MDATPGTTADTKVVLMELHDVGPTKLFDTGALRPSAALEPRSARDPPGEGGRGRRQAAPGLSWCVGRGAVTKLAVHLINSVSGRAQYSQLWPHTDAAGIDERGLLGEKKRRKVLGVLKETDVAVVVLDVAKYVG